ncbi:TTC31 protein, partial [Eudromia elegans]|nr:TTC31 protein [Eudromia elegans]
EELVAEEERVKKKAEKKKLKKKVGVPCGEGPAAPARLPSLPLSSQGSSSRDGAAGSDGSDGSSAEGPEGCAGSGPSPCPTEGPGGPEEPAGVGGAEEVPEVRGARGRPTPRGGRAAPPAPRAALLPQDDLDLSCTFVSKARQKAGVKLPSPTKEKPASTEDALPGTRPRHKVSRSPRAPGGRGAQQVALPADLGNEAAQKGLYAAAVQAFTDAMQLNPREHRLFGNRSYCYEKLERYEEALQDAQASLRLQPGWPKGLFRKGKALRGLKRYAEAARAFQELLHRDGSRADAAAQLEQCRALLQLAGSRGASWPGPPAARCPLPGASPVPLSPVLPPAGQRPNGSGVDRNGLVANPGSKSPSKGQVQAAADKTQTLPPQHPARGCYPLWVGNVSAGVTKQALQSSFSRFGQIRFIRVLPGRRCAFVNFVQKEAAEAAYRTMLDADVQGTRLALQLKHPCHATPPPGGHKP